MRRRIFAVPVAFISAVAPLSLPLSSVMMHHHSSNAVAAHTIAVIPSHPKKPNPRDAVIRATLVELSDVAAKVRHTVPELRAEWQHVAICEVGGDWKMVGSWYSGIGFLNSTWTEYGGAKYAPVAGRATRDQQILIGMKVTGGYVPDQNGCSPTGW